MAVAPPAAAPMPDGDDPMFFAEEFAARRRRYIPMNVANILLAAKEGIYKDYNFPFITGDKKMKGKEEDYPALFKAARDTRFRKAVGYVPTTRFEALTFEAYQQATDVPKAAGPTTQKSSLEKTREFFVNSLVNGDVIADLSLLRARPTSPVGSTEFSLPKKPDKSTGKAVKPPRGLPASRTEFDFAVTVSPPPHQDRILMINYLLSTITRLDRPPTTLLHLYLVRSVARVLYNAIGTWITQGILDKDPAIANLRNAQQRLNADINKLSSLIPSGGDPAKLSQAADIIAQDLVQVAKDNQAIQTQPIIPPDAYATEFINLMIPSIDREVAKYNSGTAFSYFGRIGQFSDLVDGSGKFSDFGQGTPFQLRGSLLEPVIYDLRRTITGILTAIYGSSASPPPFHRTHGYLSRDFVAYLQRIASTPPPATPGETLCEEILFKESDLTLPTSKYVDMYPFLRVIIPEQFGTPMNPEFVSRINVGTPARPLNCPDNSDPMFREIDVNQLPRTNAHTIEEAYDAILKRGGSSFERYIQFIEFIYIFFDHIPEVRPVLDALLNPLVVMLSGIILRGLYQGVVDDPLSMLNFYSDPVVLRDNTTFAQASIAFDPTSNTEDAVRAVIQMYRSHRPARTAIQSLVQGGGQGIEEIGYLDPTRKDDNAVLADLLALPIADFKLTPSAALAVYKTCGIQEFNLPSIGEAHMVLPLLLGLRSQDIRTLIYSLSACLFASGKEYVQVIETIRKRGVEYRSLSKGRYASADPTLTFPNTVVKVFARIGPGTPPTPEYLDPVYPTTSSVPPYLLPHSWDELLYPAYVSHIIVTPQLLAPIAGCLVRPCLQLAGLGFSLPSTPELYSGHVQVTGWDIDNNADIFGAVFEFPVISVSVVLPPGTSVVAGSPSHMVLAQFPRQAVASTPSAIGATAYSIQRIAGPIPTAPGPNDIVYNMVHALGINAVVTPPIIAWTDRPLAPDSNPFVPVSILKKRTRLLWAALPVTAPTLPGAKPIPPAFKFSAPTSGDITFIPAVETDLFLSSLFDWRLQLYYLQKLRDFLVDRTLLSPYLAKIDAAFIALAAAKPDVIASLAGNDEMRDIYIRNNTINNLMSGPLPYAGLRNLIFNVAGPIASANLSDILKTKEVIDSFNLSIDTRRFYTRTLPTPLRGPLVFDIDIDDYLALLTARLGSMISLAEKPEDAKKRVTQEQKEQRERDIGVLLQKSAQRLKDPYSILIDDIVTRALYTRRR